MTNPQSNSQKSILRKSLRKKLRELKPDSTFTCVAFEQWLIAHPERRMIAIYSPLPGEVDFSSILPRFPKIQWVYPRIFEQYLTFHSGEKLVPGTLGILEPCASSPEFPLCEIDAFICPGLGFTPQGHRLGRGRGFYDRMLSQARPDALKIGICFDFQLVNDTFSEAHDIPMDDLIYA